MYKKTALVTGASHGIGRQIAKDFALDEYNVCINYNNSKEEAFNLKEEIMSENPNASIILYKADVKNREQVDSMVDMTIKSFGNIDIVVNNAGIAEYKLFTDIKYEELLNMFNITVGGAFNVTQSVLKKCMINKKSGSIINISSIWGMVGSSCEVNYSTMKAALIGMTKALAKELGPSNIRVNAVAPGVIDTKMNSNLTSLDIENLKEEIPLNRIGNVEDISQIVKFLASDKASYITGQVISPNGGLVI